MDPITIALLASTAVKGISGFGKSQGWWGKPPKRKRSAEELSYVEELKRRTKEGVFTPEQQRQTLGMATTRGEEVGARVKGDIMGRLVGQGLERSIVGTQATRDINVGLLRETAQMAKDLALQNERSKIQAQDVLGQYGQQKTMQKYQEAMERYGARQAGTQQMLGAFGALPFALSGLGKESAMTDYYKSMGSYYGQRGGQDTQEQSFMDLWNAWQAGGQAGGTTNFDAMSFNEAFAEASRQGLKEFMWRGKPYNTQRK